MFAARMAILEWYNVHRTPLLLSLLLSQSTNHFTFPFSSSSNCSPAFTQIRLDPDAHTCIHDTETHPPNPPKKVEKNHGASCSSHSRNSFPPPSPRIGKDDVILVVDHVGIRSQEEQVIALLHRSKSGAGHHYPARALEALDRRAHCGLELEHLRRKCILIQDTRETVRDGTIRTANSHFPPSYFKSPALPSLSSGVASGIADRSTRFSSTEMYARHFGTGSGVGSALPGPVSNP